MIPPLKNGPWKLAELPPPSHGLKVFSCFCCGGGSTMGYKLAGFRSVGGCDIDPDMANLYRANHSPKDGSPWSFFEMPIQKFLDSLSLDDKAHPGLMELDVLDGSPPCSSFSMSGNREKDWGDKKKFREGQADQVLDDLFFQFISVAKILRPKMVVSENVKGLVMGNARGYVRDIFRGFDDAGYDTQLFLLDSSTMGVPQARKRVFFVSRRKDLKINPIKLEFSEKQISVWEAISDLPDDGTARRMTERQEKFWRMTTPGDSFAKVNNGSWFNWFRLHPAKPANTLAATCRLCHPTQPRLINYAEAKRLQSFPDDYDFQDRDGRYVCGMSVPPLMMQRVASEVVKALLARPGRSVRRPKPRTS